MVLKDTIIFMQGGPATGKTTVGERLAGEYQIPYFSKDGVKEPIFDHVGCPTAWETDGPLAGKKMDDAAITILLYLIEAHAIAGKPCIIDSTFQAVHVPALMAIATRHPFTSLQIHCRADAEELRQRYRRRANTGERHPGHLDHALADGFDADRVEKVFRPLEIGGHVLSLDTTKLSESDFAGLLESIESLVGR